MTSVLNSAAHATQTAKSHDKSTTSGRTGGLGQEAAGEFASLFGVMMDIGGRQDLAAPATGEGKASPLNGLAAEVLGPSVHIITTAEPATSDDSLLAFARAQGMDEEALSLIFGRTASAAAGAGNGAALPAADLLGGRSALPLNAPVPAPMPATADDGMNELSLGPDATLRWSVAAGTQAAALATKELAPTMFGLNGLRSPLPATAAPAATAEAAVAATPESANQSLAASLMLGAAEAGQAARKMQMKQAGQRAERIADLAPSPTRLAVGTEAGAVSEAAASPVAVETLTIDTGLGDAELQAVLQSRAGEGRGADSGQGNQGQNAPQAETHSDLDLRAEQYEKLSQRLGEALGQRLAAQIAKGDWKVEMALRPHDLGNVDIELSMKNGGLEASFMASEARTRELISDGLPRLKEVLAQLGMDVASVNVNVRQNSQHGGNPTPGKQSTGVAGVAAKRSPAEDSGTTAVSPARSGPTSNDGLDVLV